MDELFNTEINNDEFNEDELFDLEMKYFNHFHQAIPREMMPSAITNEEIKVAIQKCLETNNSDILSVLNVKVDKEHLY